MRCDESHSRSCKFGISRLIYFFYIYQMCELTRIFDSLFKFLFSGLQRGCGASYGVPFECLWFYNIKPLCLLLCSFALQFLLGETFYCLSPLRDVPGSPVPVGVSVFEADFSFPCFKWCQMRLIEPCTTIRLQPNTTASAADFPGRQMLKLTANHKYWILKSMRLQNVHNGIREHITALACSTAVTLLGPQNLLLNASIYKN